MIDRAPRELRPYQATARDFLLTTRNALLAADPGLGKTATAIRAALGVGADRVLVLCPAVARAIWTQEPRKWGWTGRVVVAATPEDITDEPGLYIMSYGQLARPDWWRAARFAARWRVLVADEAHRLKDRGTNATRGVYGRNCTGTGGIAAHADRVWLLSGTPAPNHYAEVWTHLHALAPWRIPNGQGLPMGWTEFLGHVCDTAPDGFGGERVVRNKNGAWLKGALDGFMLRQRKAQVAPDMPPLDIVDTPLDVDPAEIARQIMDAGARLPFDLPDDDDDEFLAHASRDMHIATLRRALGRAKATPAAEWIAGELDAGTPKMIVFAVHLEVLDALQTLLRRFRVARVDGSTPSGARDMAQRAFQTVAPGAPRIFLGQLRAAGEALTLTAASDVALVEASWTPSDNFQAVCRAHRLGQTRGVLGRLLYAPGTLDERIAQTLRRKTAELAEVFENGDVPA